MDLIVDGTRLPTLALMVSMALAAAMAAADAFPASREIDEPRTQISAASFSTWMTDSPSKPPRRATG